MLPHTYHQGPDNGRPRPGSLWRRTRPQTGLPISREDPYVNRILDSQGVQRIQQGHAGVYNNNIALLNSITGNQCHHSNPRDCQHHGNHYHDHPHQNYPGIDHGAIPQINCPVPSGMFPSLPGQHGDRRNWPPALNGTFPPFDGGDVHYISSTPARQGALGPRNPYPGRRPSPGHYDYDDDESDSIFNSDDDSFERYPPWMDRGRGGRGGRRIRPPRRRPLLPIEDWDDLDLYTTRRRSSPDSQAGRSSSYVRERPGDTKWWCAKLP